MECNSLNTSLCYEALVDAYVGEVFKTAFTLLGEESLAWEVVNSVFCSLLKKHPQSWTEKEILIHTYELTVARLVERKGSRIKQAVYC